MVRDGDPELDRYCNRPLAYEAVPCFLTSRPPSRRAMARCPGPHPRRALADVPFMWRRADLQRLLEGAEVVGPDASRRRAAAGATPVTADLPLVFRHTGARRATGSRCGRRRRCACSRGLARAVARDVLEQPVDVDRFADVRHGPQHLRGARVLSEG